MRRSSIRDRYDRGCPHGLMFHRFRSSREDSRSQGALTPDEFEQILLYVGIERIRSPHEWLSRLEAHRLTDRDVCLTFDDGLRSQAEHALPALNRYGLQAFWFVYSCVSEGVPVKSELYSHVAGQMGGMGVLIEAMLDRCPPGLLRELESKAFHAYAKEMREEYPFYSLGDVKYRFLRGLAAHKASFESVMDGIISEYGYNQNEIARRLWLADDDLKSLADQEHYVGLHSYDHPYEIGRLPLGEQQRQYERNHAHIWSVTGRRPTCMAHPLNSYNADSLNVLGQLGIRCGFRSNMLPPASAGMNPTCLELAREDAVTVLSEARSSDSLARIV